jgi:hypothetical protein
MKAIGQAKKHLGGRILAKVARLSPLDEFQTLIEQYCGSWSAYEHVPL